MKVNKNIVMIKENTKVGGMLLEAGDAFVKVNGRWTIFEAEGDEEDKEDEKEMKEEDDDEDKEDKEDEKKEESKKK